MARKPLRLLPADHARVIYHFAPEVGVDPAELLAPGYWSNVASTLRPGDEIIVIPEDGAWRSHLIVRAAAKVEATVQQLSLVQLGEQVIEELGAYKVAFRGRAKWGVVKQETGEVLKDGIETKEAAALWMASHMKEMA